MTYLSGWLACLTKESKDVGGPGVGVTGDCELWDVGARD